MALRTDGGKPLACTTGRAASIIEHNALTPIPVIKHQRDRLAISHLVASFWNGLRLDQGCNITLIVCGHHTVHIVLIICGALRALRPGRGSVLHRAPGNCLQGDKKRLGS